MAKLGTPRRRKPTAQDLKDQELAQALEELLGQVGYSVTWSRTLESRGGDCVVHGQRRVILSRRLSATEQADLLLDVLRRLDLGDVFVRPDIRELLEAPREKAS